MSTNESPVSVTESNVVWWSDPRITHVICNAVLLVVAAAGMCSLLTHSQIEAAMKVTMEQHYKVFIYLGALLLASMYGEHHFTDLPRQRLMNQVTLTLVTIALMLFFGMTTVVGLVGKL